MAGTSRAVATPPFVVWALIVLFGALAFVSITQTPRETLSLTQADGHVRQVAMFTNVTAMSAASTAVVRATVLTIRPGRAFPPEAGPIAFTEVVLRIDSVVAGSINESTVVLEIDDAMFPTLGSADRAWPVNGRETLIFLHKKSGASTYRPINSQGAYTIDGSTLRAADEHDSFAAAVANSALENVLSEARVAER